MNFTMTMYETDKDGIIRDLEYVVDRMKNHPTEFNEDVGYISNPHNDNCYIEFNSSQKQEVYDKEQSVEMHKDFYEKFILKGLSPEQASENAMNATVFYALNLKNIHTDVVNKILTVRSNKSNEL